MQRPSQRLQKRAVIRLIDAEKPAKLIETKIDGRVRRCLISDIEWLEEFFPSCSLCPTWLIPPPVNIDHEKASPRRRPMRTRPCRNSHVPNAEFRLRDRPGRQCAGRTHSSQKRQIRPRASESQA